MKKIKIYNRIVSIGVAILMAGALFTGCGSGNNAKKANSSKKTNDTKQATTTPKHDDATIRELTNDFITTFYNNLNPSNYKDNFKAVNTKYAYYPSGVFGDRTEKTEQSFANDTISLKEIDFTSIEYTKIIRKSTNTNLGDGAIVNFTTQIKYNGSDSARKWTLYLLPQNGQWKIADCTFTK